MSRSIDCPVWQRVTIQSILALYPCTVSLHCILAVQVALYPCTAKERENAVSDNEPSVLGICPDSLYWHRSLTPLKNICPWRLRLYWHRSLQNKEHLLSLVRRKLTFWRLYLTSTPRSLFLHQYLTSLTSASFHRRDARTNFCKVLQGSSFGTIWRSLDALFDTNLFVCKWKMEKTSCILTLLSSANNCQRRRQSCL